MARSVQISHGPHRSSLICRSEAGPSDTSLSARSASRLTRLYVLGCGAPVFHRRRGHQVGHARRLAGGVVPLAGWPQWSVLALVPGARRNWSWRTLLVRVLLRRDADPFVHANKLTTAANAIFLQSTAPLYLLLLGPWLLKEPVRRADLLLMVIVALRHGAVLPGQRGAAPHGARSACAGNVLALIAGMAWALTLAGCAGSGAAGRRREQGMATVVAGNALACLVCLPRRCRWPPSRSATY